MRAIVNYIVKSYVHPTKVIICIDLEFITNFLAKVLLVPFLNFRQIILYSNC